MDRGFSDISEEVASFHIDITNQLEKRLQDQTLSIKEFVRTEVGSIKEILSPLKDTSHKHNKRLSRLEANSETHSLALGKHTREIENLQNIGCA